MSMIETSIQVGNTVKFAKPENELEQSARFVVTEVNGDRGFMRLVCSLPIPPVELFRVSDVVVAGE